MDSSPIVTEDVVIDSVEAEFNAQLPVLTTPEARLLYALRHNLACNLQSQRRWIVFYTTLNVIATLSIITLGLAPVLLQPIITLRATTITGAIIVVIKTLEETFRITKRGQRRLQVKRQLQKLAMQASFLELELRQLASNGLQPEFQTKLEHLMSQLKEVWTSFDAIDFESVAPIASSA